MHWHQLIFKHKLVETPAICISVAVPVDLIYLFKMPNGKWQIIIDWARWKGLERLGMVGKGRERLRMVRNGKERSGQT